MKERPILFSAPMIQAVLAGRKVQTRRIIKPQPTGKFLGFVERPIKSMEDAPVLRAWFQAEPSSIEITSPYGKKGDRLWVRENFSYHRPYVSDHLPIDRGQEIANADAGVHYWADGNPEWGDWGKIRPSIHMPRWASRILLEVVNIRVERLQNISAKDAIAEGVVKINRHYLMDPSVMQRRVADLDGNYDRDERYYGNDNAPGAFFTYFEKLNGRDVWEKNPWVWVVEFKRVQM